VKTIVGLDLGTLAGYAAIIKSHTGIAVTSGRWDCSIKVGHDSPTLRFDRFEDNLRDLLKIGVDRLFYENVRSHMGVQAGHIFGGFKATMMRVCDEVGVVYQALEVSEIKKYATGKGNASKARVVEAMTELGYAPQSEDEADALAVALTGLTHIII
jgi:Holliday junction resolvasome RuvABC endonuclease subunit